MLLVVDELNLSMLNVGAEWGDCTYNIEDNYWRRIPTCNWRRLDGVSMY